MTRFFAKRAMSVTDAHAAQQAGELLLVDVREATERSAGFARGSRHLPFGQLAQGLGELAREIPLGFICQSGHRSAAAAAAARAAGRPARSVTGGMTAWRLADLPTERTTA